MSRPVFDRFMVVAGLGSNPKVGRLTDAEFRCMVTGVWSLAAKADPRGFLLVGNLPAEPGDVAHLAHCSVAVARKTIDKMKSLGMLEVDDATGWLWCHDWDVINPSPKQDNTAAERQRRRREKLRAEQEVTPSASRVSRRDGRDGHGGEEEVEEKGTPPTPRSAGGARSRGRRRDRERQGAERRQQAVEFVTRHGGQPTAQRVGEAATAIGLAAMGGGQVTDERVLERLRRLEPSWPLAAAEAAA